MNSLSILDAGRIIGVSMPGRAMHRSSVAALTVIS
jgi:hypothetical protein